MINNDVLRSIRYMLDLSDSKVVDTVHLADPVYAPDRCSVGFHPLHTAPAIVVYAGLVVPRRTRLFGIGLLLHIALDAIDCVWMRCSS